MHYQDFLATKRIAADSVGFNVALSDLNPILFPFQQIAVQWTLQRGRAAIFFDTGLGKTHMQLDWAYHVNRHTQAPVLILAPLAVSVQTTRKGQELGYDIALCERPEDVQEGINITNYEKLHHFDPSVFGGIGIDESSILKGMFDAPTRKLINDFASVIPYRSSWSATPAPNDLLELVNQAEFLGIMSESDAKGVFFTQDGNSSNKYRLRGHAQRAFWQWVSSWAIAARKPSDLGKFDDAAYDLPPLNIEHIAIDTDWKPEGYLIPTMAVGLSEQRQARRESLTDRVQAAADLANSDGSQWLVWCDLNDESAALAKAIDGAIEVKGSDSASHKAKSMLGFQDGSIRVLVTKPSICGWGMNWQNCNKQVFVGLSHSYESFYQAVRRSWRYGQTQSVTAYVITSAAEESIIANIQRKEKQANGMMDSIVQHMSEFSLGAASREEMDYREDVASTDKWTMYLGDSVLTIDNVADNSVGLCVFSPPFPGMYAYTNSRHDMGNVKSISEMIEQFRYLVKPHKLQRVMMPGRNVFIHLTQGVAQKGRDGYIGLKDFRGEVIRTMQEEGWIYYGEITIQKNPQIKAIRTKDAGLMFKSLATDSAKMHPALPDTVLQFKKVGDNTEPIKAGISKKYNNPNGWVTSEEWIKWAAPIWTDIDETNVLNVSVARESNDERHLCPLQLDVIERIVKVWSNPNDVVLSPFAGIGSEGVVSLKYGRRFVGMELKEGYWKWACRHLEQAVMESQQDDLFSLMNVEVGA